MTSKTASALWVEEAGDHMAAAALGRVGHLHPKPKRVWGRFFGDFDTVS